MAKIARCAALVAALSLPCVAISQEAPLAHSTICPGTADPMPAATLVSKLKSSGLAAGSKDEFESNAEYRARMSNLAEKVFPGGIVSVATRLEPYKMSYDADKRQLTVEVIRSDYHIKRSDLAVTEIQNDMVTTGHYMAQNDYGATREVEARTVKEVVVAWKGMTASVVGVKAHVDISPEDARNLKENADLIIVGTIVEPLVQLRSELRLPTMDFPSRTSTESYALFLTPRCLYLRDGTRRPFGLKLGK